MAAESKRHRARLSLIDAFNAAERRNRVSLDETDVKLLELLCDDGRLSTRALAREVGLTEATVALHVRSMLSRRVLHIGACLNWAAAGYKCELLVMVAVANFPVKETGRAIAALDGVILVMEVFGQFDLVLRVILPDLNQVGTFRAELSKLQGVHSADLVVVNRNRKYTTRLATRSAVRHPPAPPQFPDPVIPLDDLDRALINQLLNNGRQSNREIARHVDVTEATVRTRIRKMQEADLLRIHGQVDADMAGLVAAWAFVAVSTVGGCSDEVGAKIASLPEVITVSHTTGRHDIIFFTTTPTRSHLVRFMTEVIRRMPGVVSTETHEVIDTIDLAFHWVRFVDE